MVAGIARASARRHAPLTMRDRTEAHDRQAAVEKLSLGPGTTPAIPNDVAGSSLRCPSCEHANPAGSHFCNQCGMPVHFETCGRCEAINLRGAASCHKCGCVRPGSAILASTSMAPAVVRTRSTQAAPLLDPDTDSPPDVADAAQRRRHGGMRGAVIALAVALVGVPTYIAMEHPATFHRVIDAMAPRGSLAADPPAPISAPLQRSSAGPAAEPVNVQSVPPAAASEAASAAASEAASAAAPEGASAASQAASAPPSETARDARSPSAATSAAVAPALAKSSRTTTTKSNASRPKQGTSSRKPSTRKPATKKS